MDEISIKVCSPIPSSRLYLIYPRKKTYDALAYHVSQSNMNRQRIKTVSLWSLQMTANAILSALKNIADPVSAHLKEVYLTGQQGMMLGFYDSIPASLGVDV